MMMNMMESVAKTLDGSWLRRGAAAVAVWDHGDRVQVSELSWLYPDPVPIQWMRSSCSLPRSFAMEEFWLCGFEQQKKAASISKTNQGGDHLRGARGVKDKLKPDF